MSEKSKSKDSGVSVGDCIVNQYRIEKRLSKVGNTYLVSDIRNNDELFVVYSLIS
jgi:hypothetical protein